MNGPKPLRCQDKISRVGPFRPSPRKIEYRIQNEKQQVLVLDGVSHGNEFPCYAYEVRRRRTPPSPSRSSKLEYRIQEVRTQNG